MTHFENEMQKHGLTMENIDWTAPYIADLNAARDRDVYEEEVAGLQNERVAEFDRVCPYEYRVTDINQLKKISPRALEIVNHSLKGRSLLVNGPSRRGKTRAVWLLLRRLFIEHGANFDWFTASRFADAAIQASKEDGLSRFIAPLLAVPILFIDDLGKAKMTPKSSEALFELVEGRTSRLKPIIITTNYTRNELNACFEDEKTSVPLISRIIEFSSIITL